MSAEEVVVETAEEIVDGVAEVVQVFRTNPKIVVAFTAAGVALGTLAGYFAGVTKAAKDFEKVLDEEIAKAKAYYSTINKVDEDGSVLTPSQVLGRLHPEAAESLADYQGNPEGDPEVTSDEDIEEEMLRRLEEKLATSNTPVPTELRDPGDAAVQQNVFTENGVPDGPYVISEVEFLSADLDFEQVALTYFEQDDTLVDENDAPVEVESTIGDEALTKFGQGTKDHNMVHVRNEKEQIDYEVSLSKGSYVNEVLGLGEEPNSLKHSDSVDRRRAFRRGFDG